MYSNARLSKPYSPLKSPRSAVDEFEVGTHRPSYTTFSGSPRTLSFPVTARRLSSCSMPP